MTIDQGTVVGWIAAHGVALLIGALVLFVIYRYAAPAVHRVVLGILTAQQATLTTGGAPADELRKRAATLEELLGKLIRGVIIAAFFGLVLTVFDLWPLVAGVGIIVAALTVAGQSIVLDYLMGILILFEGQYFNGDWISVAGGPNVVEGEVEEVGLRRTVLRDAAGVVHSVSNGTIRVSSNLTRVYAIATVEIQILRSSDVDRVIVLVDEIGREMAADAEWKERVLEAPHYASIPAMTLDGATIRVRGRVRPEDRWVAASELRRRIAARLAAEGISTARWDAPMPGETRVPAQPGPDEHLRA